MAPAKPTTPTGDASTPPVKRGRGRPPKDPSQLKPKPVPSGRPRGRPKGSGGVKKTTGTTATKAKTTGAAGAPVVSTKTGRPRGRPPKAKAVAAEEPVAAVAATPGRTSGRRKSAVTTPKTVTPAKGGPKRGGGGRKSKDVEEEVEEEGVYGEGEDEEGVEDEEDASE